MLETKTILDIAIGLSNIASLCDLLQLPILVVPRYFDRSYVLLESNNL